MQTINIHEAKTHLSRLIEDAMQGDGFIIAKAGRPMVKVTRIDAAEATSPQRLGFMRGEFIVPDDFDTMGSAEIEQLFSGASLVAAPKAKA
jgi:prevent-host-death family protein